MIPTPEDLVSFFNQPSKMEGVCYNFNHHKLKLNIIREDLLHEGISGNKFRKLKHHLLEYVTKASFSGVVTFGGAYSNHIAATAAAGEIFNIPTIGIIRGDEEIASSNPTLMKAKSCGMKLLFVDRETYRSRNDISSFKLKYPELQNHLWVPEGGSGDAGYKGVIDWFKSLSLPENAIVHIACGTGTTLKGMMLAQPQLKYRGYLAVKDSSVQQELENLAVEHKINLKVSLKFVGKGYARISDALCENIQDFFQQTGVKLDPVYTGKAVMGTIDQMIHNNEMEVPNYFIHTGGMQGWVGYPKEEKQIFG